MKKITIGLTPLMDMLLLIIFLYNMQSLTLVEKAKESEKEAIKNKISTQERLKEENEYRARREYEVALLKKENEALNQEISDLKTKTEDKNILNKQLSDELSKIFSTVSEEEIQKVLSGMPKNDLEDIKRKMNEVKEKSPDEIVKYIARNSVAKKFTSNWTFRLESDFYLVITDEDDVKSTREVNFISPLSKENIRNAIDKEINQLSRPKELLLIFYNWGNCSKINKDIIGDSIRELIPFNMNLKGARVIDEGYREK